MNNFIPEKLEPVGFVLHDGTILRAAPVIVDGFEQIRIPMSDGSVYRITVDNTTKRDKDRVYAVVRYPHPSGLDIKNPALPTQDKFVYTSTKRLQEGLSTLLARDAKNNVYPA